MTDTSLDAIIMPLIRATEDGRLTWNDDPTGGYITRIGANIINIYQDNEQTTLRVLDEGGQVVEWMSADTELMPHGLQRLFTLARRKARNIDIVISDILHHLEPTGSSTR